MENSENDKGGLGELFECTRDAGFRPGSRACCLARPAGRHYNLVRLEERNLCVEQKWPKPVTPRPASSDEANASNGRANSLCSNKARQFMGASTPGAGRQASDTGKREG